MRRLAGRETFFGLKRPLCLAAVVCVLFSFLYIRLDGGASPPAEELVLQCTGRILDKQLKESYGSSYWQVTLEEVRVIGEDVPQTEKGETPEALLPEAFFREMERRKVLCSLKPGEAEPIVGEMLTVQGRLRNWEKASNPGQFDFGRWYRSQGIVAQLKRAEVVEESGTKNSLLDGSVKRVGFREQLWRLRQWGTESLEACLGAEKGALISAMVLGEKSNLSEETKALYQQNGISHILSISGLHLMLLGMGLYRALQKLACPNMAAVPLSMVIMAVYCIFTGSSVSTVRATLMFCVLLLAKLIGRSYDSLSALGLAAILQLISNPWSLLDSGFQLSYLAVVGVSAVVPRLNQIFSLKHKLMQSMMVSVGVSLATLPVLLYQFGTYPWHSIFLNLLVVPVMAVLLWLSLLLLALAAMFSPASLVCGGLSWLIKAILFYYEACCRLFEKLPVWSGYQGRPLWICIFLFYLGVILLLWKPFEGLVFFGQRQGLSASGAVSNKKKRWLCLLVLLSGKKKRWLHLLGLLSGKKKQWLTFLGLLACVQLLQIKPQGGMELTMLDVGQGDSIVIRSDSGRIYLSDCGSSSVSKVGAYRLLPFLKVKGYGRIEGIFISHLDADHYNGILELLESAEEEHISIQALFLPESVRLVEEGTENKLTELLSLAEATDVSVIYLQAGDRIRDGKTEFFCLHPGSSETGKSYESNNGSLVLSVEYGDFSFLLTGDVEKAGEEEILARIDRMGQYELTAVSGEDRRDIDEEGVDRLEGYDVLKVAHHGSAGSSSAAFLKTVGPKVSLISCGQDNSYGHPSPETLERLETTGSLILQTPQAGAITIRPKTDGSFTVEQFLQE